MNKFISVRAVLSHLLWCRHAHFTRMRNLRGRAGGKAVGYGTPCFPNGIPCRKYSEYYRKLGMHGMLELCHNF